MSWRESLGGLRYALLQATESVSLTRYREGAIHERVRLYDAAHKDLTTTWHPFVRAKAAAVWRVVEEAREHEVTGRLATDEAMRALKREQAALADAYAEAVDALQRIVHNEPDVMEIAAVALDKAEARLARFARPAPSEAPVELGDARPYAFDVKLGMDGSQVLERIQQSQQKFAQWENDVRRKARDDNSAPPVAAPSDDDVLISDPRAPEARAGEPDDN
jgi:CheY-like chemotaxis protein